MTNEQAAEIIELWRSERPRIQAGKSMHSVEAWGWQKLDEAFAIAASVLRASAAHRAEVESDVEEAKKHALCRHNRGGFRVSPTQMQCADCRFVYEQDGKVQEQAINALIRVVQQQLEAEVERLTKARDEGKNSCG